MCKKSTSMSSVFLHSPPDHLGFMDNETIRMGIAKYLGLPPIIAPLVGRFVGRKGTVVDEHGIKVASERLPGLGY
jgi:hypothetical protein